VLRLRRRGVRAVSVEYVDASGAVREQRGDLFVLAAYTVQNIRLLLASGIHGGGLVGRYFMNRPGPRISAVFDDRHLNGYSSPGVQAQCVDDLNGEHAAAEKLALPADEFFIRGAAIISACQRTPLEIYQDVPPDIPRWGASYKRFLRDSLTRYLSLYVVTEGLPYESAWVDLDPDHRDRYGVPAARIQRPIGRNEVRMSRFFYRKAAEILRAAGASRIWGSEAPVPAGTTTHDVGGCRMGSEPTTSVTNRYGQLWEVPNVFVAGGALFPTMSGHGPQQTVWALSYWTADALVRGRVNLADAEASG
jgi:gluconate 2-dehydrogenase alpha chain